MVNWIEHTGARIAYHRDGQGPGLVLVHGTGGNSETNWGHLVPELARNWTVVRPDYSGSGETRDEGGPLTLAQLAAQVIAAAEAAGAVPFDLVGFSLGAAVAIEIAARRPDLVKRLVLAGAFLSSEDGRQAMQFELWRDLIATDRKAMARLVLLTGFSPDFIARMSQDEVEATIATMLADNDWDGMARQTELDLAADVSEAAKRILAPTLVIGFTHDHMVPPSLARETANQIAGATYAELPTGHLGLIEQPEAFLALLRTFFKG